jgi:uncharacterized phiE125 gp8 family phage protein
MGLAVVTSSAPPITADEVGDFLRLDDFDAQSDLLDSLIAAAVEYFANETRQQLTQATLRMTSDAFPCCNTIRLPRGPLQSVTSIKYLDREGAQQTLAAGTYTVDADARPGRIVLNDGESWPDTLDQANAVEVTYVAGYATTNLPTALRIGIMLLVGHWYVNREAVVTGTIATQLPLSVESIINQHAYPEAV